MTFGELQEEIHLTAYQSTRQSLSLAPWQNFSVAYMKASRASRL